MISLYQYTIGPLIGNSCRFYPSCSEYAKEAYQQHGIVKGSYLTVRRLMKCHPWTTGGVDEVPQ